jgi:hypothetical protein
MKRYILYETDSNYVLKDYEAMGEIYAALEGKVDSAELYYGKASEMAANDTLRSDYYKKLAASIKTQRNIKAGGMAC